MENLRNDIYTLFLLIEPFGIETPYRSQCRNVPVILLIEPFGIETQQQQEQQLQCSRF